MRRNKLISSAAMLAIAASAMVVSSCSSDENAYNANYNREQYAKSWVEKFGEIDPSQDFNTATQVTANVDLSGTNAQLIRVYSAAPSNPNCQLVAEYAASNSEFKFDYPKGETLAYVLVTDADGNAVVNNYVEVNNGVINISTSEIYTRAAGDCQVTLGDTVDMGNIWIGSPNSLEEYAVNQYNTGTIVMSKVFKMYRLNNVPTTSAKSYKISDYVNLLGSNGVFGESKIWSDGKCNKQYYADRFGLDEGVSYTMKQDDDVEISFMYGGTACFNLFGYIYFPQDATEDEILKAPRYILMDDATPHGNVKSDGQAINGGMVLPSLIQGYEYSQTDHTLTGTTYKLTYFGEDYNGTPTYTFPKGTKIIFFQVINGMTNFSVGNLSYSLPWLNGKFNRTESEYHTGTAGQYERRFVTFKWNNMIIAGMEDTNDDDMNDILFWVNGEFEEDIPDIDPDPVVTPGQGWIVACEDLGSTDDYDFNDVVFKVNHVSGTSEITFTPLAAGGTLGSTVYFGNETIGEIHNLLDANVSAQSESFPMLNTGSRGSAGASHTYTVPSDFTMTSNMGGFSIIVSSDQGQAVEISAPTTGEAPQMILIADEDWAWPTERTGIESAYPDFTNWVKDSQNTDWYKNPVGSVVQ